MITYEEYDNLLDFTYSLNIDNYIKESFLDKVDNYIFTEAEKEKKAPACLAGTGNNHGMTSC